MNWRWLVALVPLAVGCAPREQNLMPLAKGHKWSYRVQGSFDSRVDDITVTRGVPVGGVSGWELVGSLGTLRIGWAGTTLLASEIDGTKFTPPIPLCAGRNTTWSGTAAILGKPVQAKAELKVAKSKDKFAGKNVETTEATLSLALPRQTTTVSSTFLDGIGLLHQEQRTDDRRVRYLEYLSGP